MSGSASIGATDEVADEAAGIWRDAMTIAALVAIDPKSFGGVVLRGLPGPARDRWLDGLRRQLPGDAPWRRVPVHVDDGRLLGGLDLGATLKAGRPVSERGLLAAIDGGVLLLPMAERVAPGTLGHITAAMDEGLVRLERDGLARTERSIFGLIALDESLPDEERPGAALLDRLAFEIDLGGLSHRDLATTAIDRSLIEAAKERWVSMLPDHDLVKAMTVTAAALGIGSLRAPIFAIRAAMALAAIAGRRKVDADDAALATRLVLIHRATRLPDVPPEIMEDEEDAPPPPDDAAQDDQDERPDAPDRPLEDQLLEAAIAALPPGLLDAMRSAGSNRARPGAGGKSGMSQRTGLRGRPAGLQKGMPRRGERLSVVETLRAAAPLQPLRRRSSPGRTITPAVRTTAHSAPHSAARIDVRLEDMRIIRRKERNRTLAIFAVDASGSSALQRLGEAKGAVELLLAECYVRRDEVALLAFRGDRADVLLPPTRSLLRAKRCLADLPGGGGTPLAHGIEAANRLAEATSRRGDTPLLVLLTDGRANIAKDGSPGRAPAKADALSMAAQTLALNAAALVVDISVRPGGEAAALAAAMGADYLPLPRADAHTLSRMVTSKMRS